MKKITFELKWAIVFVIMTFVWIILEKLFGLHDERIEMHPIFTNLIFIPAVTIYFFALREIKFKIYNNAMSWFQGFKSGLIISIIIALLCPLTQYIISTYITPDFFKNVIAYAVRKGQMTLNEAETHFTLANYMLMSTIGSLIMGTITAAIVSLFVKTK